MGLLLPPPRTSPSYLNLSGRPAATWGQVINAHASVNTLGTPEEMVASTAVPYNTIAISVEATNTAATNTNRSQHSRRGKLRVSSTT
jgi:hypothetical protein